MARSWLTNSRGIAAKVRNATRFPNYQINDLEVDAKRECPNCNYVIDNSDVSLEWPGLPAGVKFDPSDLELLEHLSGKIGLGSSRSHMFIDEFIPTLDVDQGICYTHPENLPGVRKDGSSVHFFHRTTNAYATGQRKRRKIHGDCSKYGEGVRWHKTGKTKPVLENGIQKGWKKIMVLYSSLKRGCKPDKVNWVMHQFHLGNVEEEMDGELVVSKIFYQQQSKKLDRGERDAVDEDPDLWTVRAGPRTPKTNTPLPPRPSNSPLYESHNEENRLTSPVQDEQYPVDEVPLSPLPIVSLKDENISPAWWAGEPNPNNVDEPLLCHEVLDSFHPIGGSFFNFNNNAVGSSSINVTGDRNTNTMSGFSDLDNLPLDAQPDFQLADLQFGSQESFMGWLDRLSND